MNPNDWISSLNHQAVFTILRKDGQEYLYSGVIDAGYVCCIGEGYAKTASGNEMEFIQQHLEEVKKQAKRWR